MAAKISVEFRMVREVEVAKAFDRWMDEYTNHPERFKHTWQTVQTHLLEREDNAEPSYGRGCTALLFQYMEDEVEVDDGFSECPECQCKRRSVNGR